MLTIPFFDKMNIEGMLSYKTEIKNDGNLKIWGRLYKIQKTKTLC